MPEDSKEKKDNLIIMSDSPDEAPLVMAELVDEDINPDELTGRNIVQVYKRLAPANVSFTKSGQRFYTVARSLIQQDTTGKTVFAFSVADYKKIYNITDSYPRKQLEDGARELLQPITIEDPNNPNNFLMTGIITFTKVEDGIVTFGVQQDMLNFFKFNRAQDQFLLSNTATFKNSYSYVFHELFLIRLSSEPEDQQENHVKIEMTVNEIREWLKLGNSYVDKRTEVFNYSAFRSKLLNLVYEDINRQNEQGQPLCNVNFRFEEIKVGRKISRVIFYAWRVKSYAVQPEINEFYMQQPADVKLAYDLLLAMGINKKAIEECILTYGDRFVNIVRYANYWRKKGKGQSYISAIILNGWTSSDYSDTDTIKNIDKIYSVSDQESEFIKELDSFVLVQVEEFQKIIIDAVVEYLKDTPQLLKFIEGQDISSIYATKDVKVIFLDALKDVVVSKKSPAIESRFENFRSNNTEVDSYTLGREEICKMFTKHKIQKPVWKELLVYSDNYIKANIEWAVKNYGPDGTVAKNKECAPMIVRAIRSDLAGYYMSEQKKQEEAIKLAEKLVAERVKAEAEKEAAEKRKAEKEESDLLFANFLKNSTPEKCRQLRDVVLNESLDIKKKVYASQAGISEEELAGADLQQVLLRSSTFITSMKQALKNHPELR